MCLRTRVVGLVELYTSRNTLKLFNFCCSGGSEADGVASLQHHQFVSYLETALAVRTVGQPAAQLNLRLAAQAESRKDNYCLQKFFNIRILKISNTFSRFPPESQKKTLTALVAGQIKNDNGCSNACVHETLARLRGWRPVKVSGQRRGECPAPRDGGPTIGLHLSRRGFRRRGAVAQGVLAGSVLKCFRGKAVRP